MSEKDNAELKPAEENPWYVLATLYGEEPDILTLCRNRAAWDSFFNSEKKVKPSMEEISKHFKKRLPNQNLPDRKFGIDFSNTDFKKKLDLTNFNFPQLANFNGSKFAKGLSLYAATFDSDALFRKTKLCVCADFRRARFEGEATFVESDFHTNKSLKFDWAVFKYSCDFMMVTFHGPSSFKNCQFIGPCNLSGAKFKNKYPVLEGAVLHQKTTVSAKKEYWPDPKNYKQYLEEAKATCEILREQMEAQGLHEQAHFFFRREMHFARKTGSFWQAIPNWFFYFLSDYGYSILRPVIGLLSCWITGALIYFGTTKLTFGGSMGLSVSNLLQITGLQRVYWSDVIECLPWGLKFLGGAQTLLAVPLLFLLLLGLRNRFRLK